MKLKTIFHCLIASMGLFLSSCSGDEVERSFSDMTLQIGIDQNIPIVNGEGIEWESENDLVAKVTQVTKLTPDIAGETIVRGIEKSNNRVYQFKVTSVPTNNDFIEPYLNFERTENQIYYYHGLMAQRVWQNSRILYYMYQDWHPLVKGYYYGEDDLGVPYAAMLVENQYATMLTAFLGQRYKGLYSGNNTIICANYDKSIYVTIAVDKRYTLATFTPASAYSRAGMSEEAFAKAAMTKAREMAKEFQK